MRIDADLRSSDQQGRWLAGWVRVESASTVWGVGGGHGANREQAQVMRSILLLEDMVMFAWLAGVWPRESNLVCLNLVYAIQDSDV